MSDGNVVTDFTQRRSGRIAFARLAALLERREAEILADPIKHLGDAGKMIAEQARFIESLQEELRRSTGVRIDWATDSAARPSLDSIIVERREWEGLKRIAALLRSRG